MESAVYNIIGEKLKKIRTEKGLTQDDISKVIDCSTASIANYEKGEQSIYISDLYKIAIYLDIDIKHFLPTNDEVKKRLPEYIIDSSALRKDEKSAIKEFIERSKSTIK